MKSIEITITGVTPLLINRFHEEAREEATSGIHARHEHPEPADDARERLYLLADQPKESPYFPAENLRQSIIAAAGRHKIGRRSAASDVAAAVYLAPDAMPLAGGWAVDSRPVVIPATRGRIMRHRPKFEQWAISFTLNFEERLISPKLARDCVDDAGDYVGIGDFRPARKGPFGRFKVTRWEPR